MKKICIVILQLMLVVSLAACGNDSNNNIDSENVPIDIINQSREIDLTTNSGTQIVRPEQALAENSIEKTRYGASSMQYVYHFTETGVCNGMTTKLYYANTDEAKQGYDKLSSAPVDEMNDLKIEENIVSYIIPGNMFGKNTDEIKKAITIEGSGYTEYSTAE